MQFYVRPHISFTVRQWKTQSDSLFFHLHILFTIFVNGPWGGNTYAIYVFFFYFYVTHQAAIK